MYSVNYKLSHNGVEYQTNLRTRSKKKARAVANQVRSDLNDKLYFQAMAYIVKITK